MSLIGVLSIAVLALSFCFIYVHSKFIGLHKRMNESEANLREVLWHKIHLLLYFATEADVPEYSSSTGELIETVRLLKSKVNDKALKAGDIEELAELEAEFAGLAELHEHARAEYRQFTSAFPGWIVALIYRSAN